MTMTSEQLRALIEQQAPADLTPEECAALREVVRTSPELLRDLAERIQIEEFLTQALGRPPISAKRVLERLARRRAHSIGVRTRYGLLVCGVSLHLQLHQLLNPLEHLHVVLRDHRDTPPALPRPHAPLLRQHRRRVQHYWLLQSPTHLTSRLLLLSLPF